MGNAGDLLKHGVLAEVIRWQCEQGIQLRFIDLFGGEPWKEPVSLEIARRVWDLPTTCALRVAQTGIENGRYYGSGWVARYVGMATESGTVRVITSDQDQDRRKRLCDSGLSLLTEKSRTQTYLTATPCSGMTSFPTRRTATWRPSIPLPVSYWIERRRSFPR